MKNIYLLAAGLILLSFFTGCSKDFLRSYEHRLEGSWRLTDVDRTGIGGNINNLPFKDGVFTFFENGQLDYVNTVGETYKGSWDIRRQTVRGNCSSDANGNRQCDDRTVRSLHITCVNFQTQDVRSEYFQEIVFTNTNRFKGFISDGLRGFVLRFVRQ